MWEKTLLKYAIRKDDFIQYNIDNDPGFNSFSFDGF